MPTKTKPKPKAKPKAKKDTTLTAPPTPAPSPTKFLRLMISTYESETGARANQVRLIDFIRWWEEREKNGNTS
ncbi:hypothetical protein LCGC14_0776750 [marine sediment metagenome]|uniref:Uncharacterized protein n=1 Tax=marine sediment metagenome TaxID=412755 RepID=A0A0F9SGN1_9ZZZZ